MRYAVAVSVMLSAAAFVFGAVALTRDTSVPIIVPPPKETASGPVHTAPAVLAAIRAQQPDWCLSTQYDPYPQLQGPIWVAPFWYARCDDTPGLGSPQRFAFCISVRDSTLEIAAQDNTGLIRVGTPLPPPRCDVPAPS